MLLREVFSQLHQRKVDTDVDGMERPGDRTGDLRTNRLSCACLSQDFTHSDDRISLNYDVTPGWFNSLRVVLLTSLTAAQTSGSFSELSNFRTHCSSCCNRCLSVGNFSKDFR